MVCLPKGRLRRGRPFSLATNIHLSYTKKMALFGNRRKKRRRKYEEGNRIFTKHTVRELSGWLVLTAGAVVLALVLVTAFGLKEEMNGDSMYPTIANGQYVMVDRLRFQFSRPAEGDIIVFRGGGNRMRTYIRRVVAVSGDTVQVKAGVLYVNEEPRDLPEFDKMENAGIADKLITLKAGEYFVLGDNRNNSEDSRSENISMVRLDTIIGKVWRIGGKPS